MKCVRTGPGFRHGFRFTVIAALAAIAGLCPLRPAAAHEAHVHGVGTLDVALDGNSLSLHLDSPLINLLGFEHAATSAPDRQAAQKMGGQLRMAEQVFATTPAAQCKTASVRLHSAALDPLLLGEKPGTAALQAADKHDGHADLDSDFVFNCAHPEKLQAVDVKLFDLYPGFHQINVQAVTPKGQSAVTLSPGAARIPL